MEVQEDISNLVPEFQKSKDQIGTKFGCVPLSPVYVYKGQPQVWNPISDVITAHKLIGATGMPNFWGLRIPVTTSLNVSSCRKHLMDFFDQQLPDLISIDPNACKVP